MFLRQPFSKFDTKELFINANVAPVGVDGFYCWVNPKGFAQIKNIRWRENVRTIISEASLTMRMFFVLDPWKNIETIQKPTGI